MERGVFKGLLGQAIQDADCQNISDRHMIYTMNFEFDPKKSDRNKHKHGIDFIAAQGLWNDFDLLEIPAGAETGRNYREPHGDAGAVISDINRDRGTVSLRTPDRCHG